MRLEKGIRDYNPKIDEAFIYNSFLRSLQDSLIKKFAPAFCGSSPPSFYYKLYAGQLTNALKKSKCWIVHPKNDENTIMSYIIAGKDHLIYVYSKSTFSRLGIGTELIEHAHSNLGWGDRPIFTPFVTNMWVAFANTLDTKYNFLWL